MAKTYSIMRPLGTQAPDFSLLDVVTQETVSLHSHAGSTATVIVFMCNHCPYVKYIHPVLPHLADEFRSLGVSFIGINANDVSAYPDDAPERMRELAHELHYGFPYLYDETQAVARAYQAQCTPDFFVFDSNRQLVYRGQFDDARIGNDIPVTGHSIREALLCLIENKPITIEQKPSMGCNIKWFQHEIAP